MKRCSGNVLLELALILPVAIMVVFISLEVARCIEFIQVASSLGREAASLALRECSGDAQPKLDHCLNQIRDKIMQDYAGGLVPGTVVSASVYAKNPTTSALTSGASDASGAYSTQYSLSGESIVGSDVHESPNLSSGVLDEQRTVVIGEAFVPYSPMIPGLSGLFGLSEGRFYHVTVM